MTTITLATNVPATPPTPQRMKMPRRSRRLSGTVSALDLPLLSHQLLADILLQLGEVVVATPDLGRAHALHGRVVLARDLAELLHRLLVRACEPFLALGDPGRRLHELEAERHGVAEVAGRRRHAHAQVRLPVALEHDVARVLQLGRLAQERPALVFRPAVELLVVLDVRLDL